MTTENNNQSATGREIPPLPGGGSWRFDESAWNWVSNDPATATEATPAATADAVTTTIEEEQQP
jgi:hypothetical protein